MLSFKKPFKGVLLNSLAQEEGVCSSLRRRELKLLPLGSLPTAAPFNQLSAAAVASPWYLDHWWSVRAA